MGQSGRQDHGTAGLLELSTTVIQGVLSDPGEDVAARTFVTGTPIAIWTVTDHPVQEIWFHMQVFPYDNIQSLFFFPLLTSNLSWVSKQHKKPCFSPWKYSNTGTGAQRGCRIFILGDIQNPTRHDIKQGSLTLKFVLLWTGHCWYPKILSNLHFSVFYSKITDVWGR